MSVPNETNFTSAQRFAFMVIGSEGASDETIFQLFLSVVVNDEEELLDVLRVLGKHRREVAERVMRLLKQQIANYVRKQAI